MSGVAIVNQLIFVYNLCIFGGVSGAGIFTGPQRLVEQERTPLFDDLARQIPRHLQCPIQSCDKGVLHYGDGVFHAAECLSARDVFHAAVRREDDRPKPSDRV